MAASVIKGDKWNFTRKGGQITLKGFYTVVYAPADYPTVEAESIHASYETGVPASGEACDVTGWESLFVSEKSVSQTAPHYFKVDITYTNGTLTKNSQEVPVNPTQQLPEISFFTVSGQEKIDKDKNDAVVTNSAKEPPDPPLMEDDMWMGMRVVKYYNEGEYNPNNYAGYKRSINSGTFTITGKSGRYEFANETVKFVEEGMEEVELGQLNYCKVTRVLHIRADALKWKRRLLDEGYNVITGSNIKPAATGTSKRIKTKELRDPEKAFQDDPELPDYNPYETTPTSEPTLLDGSGGILAHNGTPYFFEKEILTPISYSGIV